MHKIHVRVKPYIGEPIWWSRPFMFYYIDGIFIGCSRHRKCGKFYKSIELRRFLRDNPQFDTDVPKDKYGNPKK